MILFEDFFDEEDVDVNVDDSYKEEKIKNNTFRCIAHFNKINVNTFNLLYIKRCIESILSVDVLNVTTDDTNKIQIDFNIESTSRDKLINDVLNLLYRIWQGCFRNNCSLTIIDKNSNEELYLSKSYYINILDIIVNNLTTVTRKCSSQYNIITGNITKICNLLGNYEIEQGEVMEMLQIIDIKILYSYIAEFFLKGYSTYSFNFIQKYVDGEAFTTNGKKILDAINELSKNKEYKLSFYAYNNHNDHKIEEYEIIPNKVSEAISKLTDHQKIFTNKQITIDVNWIRQMHNEKKHETILAFPLGTYYIRENHSATEPKFRAYFFAIQYKEDKEEGHTVNPQPKIKMMINLLKKNKYTNYIDITDTW